MQLLKIKVGAAGAAKPKAAAAAAPEPVAAAAPPPPPPAAAAAAPIPSTPPPPPPGNYLFIFFSFLNHFSLLIKKKRPWNFLLWTSATLAAPVSRWKKTFLIMVKQICIGSPLCSHELPTATPADASPPRRRCRRLGAHAPRRSHHRNCRHTIWTQVIINAPKQNMFGLVSDLI